MALTNKTAAKTAVGLRKVLDKVKSEFGNPDILTSDDGGEFKGAVSASAALHCRADGAGQGQFTHPHLI